jgi:anti-sigma B factor antagonist
MTLKQLAERRAGDVTIIALGGRGEEEETTIRDRIDELLRRGRVRVVLDLQAVEYIDSTGLGTIAAKYLTLRRRGGDLKLLHVPPRALHLMTITKLTRVFELFDTEDRAIESFGHGAAATTS